MKFLAIYFHELKYWLKKPSTYLYSLIFCFVAFVYFADNLDLYREVSSIRAGQKHYNSAFNLNDLLSYFNQFFLFLLPAIVGASLYRDYNSDTYKILYSYPIDKRDYYLAKFLSSLTVVLMISASVGITLAVTESLAGVNSAKLEPFSLMVYLREFISISFANLLIVGMLVFALVSRTRNVFSAFGLIIGIFFFKELVENLFKNQHDLMALFDPLARNTVAYICKDWGAMERNTALIPLGGLLLYNRLFWLAVSSLVFLLAFKSFKLNEQVPSLFSWKRRAEPGIKTDFNRHGLIKLIELNFSFNWKKELSNYWYLSKQYLISILRSPIFYILLILAILSVVSMLYSLLINNEMNILPATPFILSYPSMFYKGTVVLLTFLFSGIILHKERASKVNELVDILPVKNRTFLAAKFTSIVLMQISLFMALILAGIAFQIYAGYYRFEIELYVYQLFGLELIGMLIWAAAALFIHSIFRNTYVGLFILLGIWLASANLNLINIRSHLPAFNKTEFLRYSDMDGFGSALTEFLTLEAYWGSLSVALVIFSYLFWQRGVSTSLKERWQTARTRWNYQMAIAFSLAAFCFAGLGFYIHQEEQKNVMLQPDHMKKIYQNFQMNFSKYADLPQPKIMAFNLKMDLYPEANSFEAKGEYRIQNRQNSPIDTLLIRGGFDEQSSFSLNIPYHLVAEDSNFNFSVIELEESLGAGEELLMSFDLKPKTANLFEKYSNVLGNGTFLKDDIFPRLGYIRDYPLKDPLDSNSRDHHAYAVDSDLIDFEATISTSPDQKVITAGKLVRKWEENDRNYFHYRTESPTKFNLGIASARYQEQSETYEGIPLVVYHHPDHQQQVNSILRGLTAALKFNQENFGPYQHSNASLVEFAHSLGTYATAYSNIIAMSEMRFLSAYEEDGENLIDMAFYTTAHELTHQWWGNQILPAAAYGSRMISESVTEYISLCLLEENYGEEAKQEFLRAQHKRYSRRRRWVKDEPSLLRVGQNDSYLFYGKGSMAFNALAHHLGKEKLIRILADFLDANRFKAAPYPTSLDLFDSLKVNSPDSLHPFLSDWFEKTITFENSISDAELTQLEDAKYQLNFQIELKKQSLENGEEESIDQFQEWVEIAFYKQGELIELKKLKLSKASSEVSFTLNTKVDLIVLDPHLLLLDTNLTDNEIKLD